MTLRPRPMRFPEGASIPPRIAFVHSLVFGEVLVAKEVVEIASFGAARRGVFPLGGGLAGFHLRRLDRGRRRA